MAFRPLTEAECGQKNPLARLASHVTSDHTFRDTHGQLIPNSSDQLVEQFLQETRNVPQTYRMDDLMREMHEIESQRFTLPPVPASRVKDQLHDDDAWALQYIEDGKVFHDNANNEAIWAEISSQEEPKPLPADNWTINYLQQFPGPSPEQESADELVRSVDDPKFVYSKFMKFMNKVADGTVDLSEGRPAGDEGRLTEQEADTWSKEFLVENKDEEEKDEDAALEKKWQSAATASAENDFNSQFWDNLQEEFRQTISSGDEASNWATEFETLYPSPYKEYTFSDQNPMFDISNPLERGKALLAEGDLPSAVLCFEAAVKQNDKNAEAWLLLGKTQAENEQDPNAIPALIKCLEIEPSNLEALMALAVSYTNESYYSQAAKTLVRWLQNNPKYGDLVPPDFKFNMGQVTSFLSPGEQSAIQDMFIKAALRNPDDVDYEIQCGLGVLFNLSGDYDKAADCFRAALSVRPDDAKLWNRLGATLANGSKSEEAVDAYHHALNLEPGFIRARYNVGIICINLEAYKEAAEHFLTALNQQARGKDLVNSGQVSQMSDTIWSTLRMCLTLMGRRDLREAVDNRDLQKLNKEFDIDI